MQISKKDKKRVLEAIKQGKIDAADLSFPNLIDAMILKMYKSGLIGLLENAMEDKRADNKNIPFHLLMILAITAKMKIKTSLADIRAKALTRP